MTTTPTFNVTRLAGFTLVELLVSIGLMSLIAGYFVYDQIDSLHQRTAESIAQEVVSLGNKASEFYGAQAPGAWPDNDPSATGCNNPVQRLISAGFLPSGYTPLATVALSFDCSDVVSGMGNTFRLRLQFPSVEVDIAERVQTLLPAATRSDTASGIQIDYVLTPPRKLGNQYHFDQLDWNRHHDLVIAKPDCGAGREPRYLAIPQALCISSHRGLGGFHFIDNAAAAAPDWRLRLLVAAGDDTSPELDSDGDVLDPAHWVEMDDRCNGEEVRVGVVTYCE